jgi:hypothetical protein
VTVLDDLGAGEYTKGYFFDTRYDNLHPSARAHSVPEIDGQTQLPGRQRRAEVLHHASDEDGIEFDLDLTAAYEVDGLRRLVRRFRWDRTRRILTLTDEVDADRPLTLTEVFVSRLRPGPSGWPGVALEHDGVSSTVEEETARDHRGVPDTAYRLCITTTAPPGVSRHRCRFSLAPDS